jgi:prepilin-type processing-associated H-X9-DG protein
LWDYAGKAAKAYNCPVDKRSIKQPTNSGSYPTHKVGGFRTFSMGAVYALSGSFPPMWATGEGQYAVTKMSQITSPSAKFVFLEEWDPRGWNDQTFNIWLNSPSWGDAIAMAHNGASTFGYADGHAERYKWTGPETRRFFDPKNQETYTWHSSPVVLSNAKDLDDYNWFVQHYIPTRKR